MQMNRLIAALVMALTLAFAGPVQAQSMDINSILNGIGGSSFLKAVSRVHSAPSVRVVRMSTLAAAERSRERVKRVVALKGRDIEYLQSGLELNPSAMTAIKYSGVSLDQIVSLHMSGDRAVVLYADDLD
jgi:hypothetical protein